MIELRRIGIINNVAFMGLGVCGYVMPNLCYAQLDHQPWALAPIFAYISLSVSVWCPSGVCVKIEGLGLLEFWKLSAHGAPQFLCVNLVSGCLWDSKINLPVGEPK